MAPPIRSELRLAPHQVRAGDQVVEIWYDGEFIGQLTGLEGPGVRLISKYLGAGQPTIRQVGDVIELRMRLV